MSHRLEDNNCLARARQRLRDREERLPRIASLGTEVEENHFSGNPVFRMMRNTRI
jgi:hypothetical protein